ncbi:MAG: sulfatase-like hydrolase/transferase [Planctomycetaceae bacterium]|nr:sulfatase-like hydrolase/transferase [Planctomycetaceae bacterium]
MISRFLLILTLLLPASVIAADPNGHPTASRPNVVMILADDLGSVDLACYGSDDLVTPNLDRLAGHGIRFTQFYAAAPVCSPSRAAFITGLFPQRAGVPGNVSSEAGKPGMPAVTRTVGEVFAENGYVTGHVGKWHLGYTDETMPNGQGFSKSFGHMGGCIDNYSHFFYWQGPNRHDLWRNGQEVFADGQYFPELMANEAEQFVEENKSRPFLLYWALNTPHYPLQGSAKWRQHYQSLPMPRREYAAFVSTTDEIIGRLLKKLDDEGLSDNTIIVFQSDHGHSTEERTFGGGGNSGPYRGAKFSLFEGGIRVPAIFSWPGHFTAGVREQLATGCDWVPTLISLCGLSASDHFDGENLTPVLQSANAPTPHQVFHWQSGGSANRPQWAIRKGPWKLIAHPNDTSHKAPLSDADDRFLVNLDAHVEEMENLASKHPEVVKELEDLHNAWLLDLKRTQP